MKLPKLAIENHQFTIVMILLLTLLGVVSFLTMPRSEDPQFELPFVSVVAIYPGANPIDIEHLVVDPVEEVVNELEDIKKFKSWIRDGYVSMQIEFHTGVDPDKKYDEVVEKVNTVRDKLPEDIFSLEMRKVSPIDVNIVQIAIVSEKESYRVLEREAEQLKKTFERIPGVKKAETWAFPQQEIQVAVDMERIAQMHISLNQVIGAIQSNNSNIPGGSIDIGTKRFNIQTSGDYESIADIRNTIVHAANGRVVYLKDIAKVNFDYEDENYYARFNDQRAVFVTATQKRGTNIYNITDELKRRVEIFEDQLPQSMRIHYVFDQAESVTKRVNGFFTNLLQGVLLLGLIALLILGVRASIIVMIAIPIPILIAIGFVDLTGYGLQQMSIVGLVIALGLLVDNAIVVTENASRFLKMGYSLKEAAIKGTQQVGWAIVSSTATTVLAFVPIVMMQNVTGDFIRSMPITVIFTLIASLLVALTLTPYLSSKLLKKVEATKETLLERSFNRLIEKSYRKTLDFALSHPVVVLTTAVGILVGSLALFPLVGVSFFPKAEKPQFIINVDLPQGTSLDKTNATTKYVESVLSSRNEIKQYAANVGHGNPRIYYNIIPTSGDATHAQVFVELKENSKEMMSKVVGELRQIFSGYPGARINIKELEQGPGVEAPIAIKILGDNLEVLEDIARDVENIIASTPGTVNIQNPLSSSKTDLHVNINRAKAGLLGIPLVSIDRTVRASIAGFTASKYRDNEGKEYGIVIRMPSEKKQSVSDFDKICVNSVTGAEVPLKQVASLEFKSSPTLINHYNLERSVNITADVQTSYSVDQATKQIIAKLDEYNWPKAYRYYVGGELESREESFGGMGQAIIIAVIGIFGVLVLQFRSFSQPMIIFSAIPLAVIGSIMALFISGYSFSFTAFIGLTSLVGIVVNDSIILVDYANQLRQKGYELLPALKEAGETRFTPIILTTATTIGGLLPLTLTGGTLWAPMGWTIIGGLLTSTFLMLLVVPVLYKIFTPKFVR